MARSKSLPKRLVARPSKAIKTAAKPVRRSTTKRDEAQLQFGITSKEGTESFHALELFLALPERIRQFTEHVVSHRPAYVFDLRTVPSFEGPQSSRRSVLESMRAVGVRYLDVMAMVDNDGSLAAHVIEFCARTAAIDSLQLRVLFLFESMRDLLWSSSILPSAFVQHTSRQWQTNFIGVDLDPSTYVNALRHWNADIPPVNRWMVGAVLHVATPMTVVLHPGGYSHNTHVTQLARGNSVQVLCTYSDFSAEVLVLNGPIRGATVRLPLMSNFARLVP